MLSAKMHVVKRSGEKAGVRFDAITDRNEILCSAAYGCELTNIDAPAITQEVVRRFENGMTTHRLDMLTVKVCSEQSIGHPEYADLAARIIVSDLQKTTVPSFLGTVERLAAARDARGRSTSRLSDEFVGIARRAAKAIDRRLAHARDFGFRYFGIMTMLRSYLFREGDEQSPVIERPQHTYMRVSLAIHCSTPSGDGHLAPEALFSSRLELAFQTYALLSEHKITHPSPLLFNAGTSFQQFASCFLLSVDDDLDTILEAGTDANKCGKRAGASGICLTPMRPKGALVRSTGGASSGVTTFNQYLEKGQAYVNQGGRRPGVIAPYLEVWHDDVLDFIAQGRIHGVVENAPQLKYGLWVPDLFMEAVIDELAATKAGGGSLPEGSEAGDWWLFNPEDVPGLYLLYGEAFAAAYRLAVARGLYRRKVKASEIMHAWFITVAQRGNPYILFKDHINRKSNLSHYRTITNSNVCAEVLLPARNEEGKRGEAEYGVCFLGAIPLASHVVPDVRSTNPGKVRIDWDGLMAAVSVLVVNIDKKIDINWYPVPPCERSSLTHRAIGLGTMGLADVFALHRFPFGSPEAIALDEAIHAAIYFAAMRTSSRRAREVSEGGGDGRAPGNFLSFEGCAAQRGLLQPDLWVAAGHLALGWEDRLAASTGGALTPDMWAGLRADCQTHLRNGYVTACMPTATSSNAIGQNECFEPFTSNLYTRKTLAGEFVLVNRHLVADLELAGIWSSEMGQALVARKGSVQALSAAEAVDDPRTAASISLISEEVRRLYRTAREMDQRLLTLHAAARNPYLSQSQSLNYYFGAPNLKKILSVIVLGYQKGLTTGSYYIHTQAATSGGRRPDIDPPRFEQSPARPEEAATPPAAPAPKRSQRTWVCSEDTGCTACDV